MKRFYPLTIVGLLLITANISFAQKNITKELYSKPMCGIKEFVQRKPNGFWHSYFPAGERDPGPGWVRNDPGKEADFYTFANKENEFFIPLFRFGRTDGGGHFYTTNYDEGAKKFRSEGHIGYLIKPDAPREFRENFFPLYRKYNPATDRHIYTIMEVGVGTVEGILGYVMPNTFLATTFIKGPIYTWLICAEWRR